ncbi:uncharacterized protein J8A68_002393 [[Candida] subhashii]|uniref:Protein OCA4 n=1 Tax=[Candida] subhashii TaxID=561895 RepID=A0A8J5V117_9ASCO|nr:uncharacterized protein J8A68_002393 [[Candida] subhashii]KAG7664069.1 hypothetical protein J8A68_002393 [[Candida] subhashii]
MLVPPDSFGLVEPGIYRCSKLETDNFPFLQTLKLKSIIILDAEKPPRSLQTFLDDNNNKIELFNLGSMNISNHHRHASTSGSTPTTHRNKTDGEELGEGGEMEVGDVMLVEQGMTGSPVLKAKTSGKMLDVISLNKRDKADQWMVIEKNIIAKAIELILNKNKHPALVVDSTSTLVGILRKIQKWNFNSILNEYRIYSGISSGSNKSNNYNAETFLELIQIELIPYEIDQLNNMKQKHQESIDPHHLLQPSNTRRDSNHNHNHHHHHHHQHRSSPFLKSPPDQSNNDDEFLDHQSNISDMDDLDDDLLSASPQIPANLLKLVEQRSSRDKSGTSLDSDNEMMMSITPGTSPQLNRSSRNNSFSNNYNEQYLRGSVDSRRRSYDWKASGGGSGGGKSNKFRPVSGFSPMQQPGRSSYEGSSGSFGGPIMRRRDSKDRLEFGVGGGGGDEIRKQFDYKYYKNLNKNPIMFENVSVMKLRIPIEGKLPDWFIKGRNYWEKNYRLLNQ